MPVFSVTAALTPTIAAPASLLIPGTHAAPVTRTPAVGDTSAVPALIDKLAANLDLTGRRGGGAYAVTEGLDISGSGLVCTVTAGQAMLDGVVTLAASGTVALADNAYNWVYLLQTGALVKTSDAGTTPPANPAAACAFLGRIQVTAGTPGTADYSGRMELRNGTAWRRTGDAGAPTDTPASTLLFVTVTAGGTYLWTGLTYADLGAGVVANANVVGGLPVLHRINVAAGTTGDVDTVLTNKTRVVDVWLVKTNGAGGGAGTITVKNGSSAITDAMSIDVADKTVVRAGTIDDAQHEIAAAGTLKITRTRTASSDETCVVYVEGIRVT